MTVIRISKNTKKAQQAAISILRSGGVIVFPTDTVYGVGGDALRRDVAQKVRRFKRRPVNKEFPWLVADVATAKRFVRLSPKALRLAHKVWPGRVALILPKRSGKGALALRVPAYPWLRRLLYEFDGPIIGTSANISGKKVAQSALEAAKLFPQAGAVFDGGRLHRRPSRIVDLTVSPPRVIRQ